MKSTVAPIRTSGAGNAFFLLDEREKPLDDLVALARELCGAGDADGILVVGPSDRADARMRIINADGSEAEMCGNGMRCVGRYLDEHDGRARAVVETLAGPVTVATLAREPYRVAVEMAAPRIGEPHEVAGFTAIPVDVGNPHVVIRVRDVDAIDLASVGPRIERDPRYEHGTNVHFVEPALDGRFRVRHWERGAGPTLACGTGGVAVAAVLIDAGEAASPVVLAVPGGFLEVRWTPGGRATLIGDAVREDLPAAS